MTQVSLSCVERLHKSLSLPPHREELAQAGVEVVAVRVVARELEEEGVERARDGPALVLAPQVLLLDLRAAQCA